MNRAYWKSLKGKRNKIAGIAANLSVSIICPAVFGQGSAAGAVDVGASRVTVLMGAFAQHTGPFQVTSLGPAKVGWVEGWSTTGGSLLWQVNIRQAGEYELSMIADGGESGVIEVQTAAGSKRVKHPAGWDRVSAGTFRLPSGIQHLGVKISTAFPIKKFFSLELQPVSAKALLDQRAASLMAPTTWLVNARYGLMFHWTSETKPREGSAKPYQQAVADFDVERFARMVEQTGAGYVIFTTSHAGYFFPGPNKVIESILPGRTCDRDLIMDLANSLGKRGVRLLLYYHPGHDDEAWWSRTHYNENKDEFFKQWCAIIRSIGERYGDKVAGFWFDDAIFTYYPFNPPWEEMTRAAKAGNPARLVIYNSWILPRVSRFYEVFAGENPLSNEIISGNGFLPIGGTGKFTGGPQRGLQGHITSFLEDDWGHFKLNTTIGPPQFSAETLISKISDCIRRKNVPSLDVEIYQDGTISEQTLGELKQVGAAFRK